MKKTNNLGIITQIVSVVIDVKFESELPNLYDALKVKREDGSVVTLEVEQILGGGIVRTIAMSSTDGLKRGMEVEGTGAPITIPVGNETLGRIFNVLGEPIDNQGEVKAKLTAPIHRQAPTFAEQSNTASILETGIKVVDLIAPFARVDHKLRLDNALFTDGQLRVQVWIFLASLISKINPPLKIT